MPSAIKNKISIGLGCVLVVLAACGEPPPPEAPPAVPPPPDPQPVKTAEPAPSAVASAPAAAPAPAPEPPPPPKPLKEQVVGKWQFDLTGEARAFHEAEARKKAGKDEAKFQKLMKEIEAASAKEWIELTADTYTSWVGEKIEAQMKYEVVKEENGVLTVKPVKDLVAKKDIKGDMTVPVSIKEDGTLSMFDPKKKINLIFKRKAQ